MQSAVRYVSTCINTLPKSSRMFSFASFSWYRTCLRLSLPDSDYFIFSHPATADSRCYRLWTTSEGVRYNESWLYMQTNVLVLIVLICFCYFADEISSSIKELVWCWCCWSVPTSVWHQGMFHSPVWTHNTTEAYSEGSDQSRRWLLGECRHI